MDDDTIVFPSTAIDPESADRPRGRAQRQHLQHLDAEPEDRASCKQFTDTLTGNVSPIVLRDQKPAKIAFVTYYKGEYGIHTLAREEPLHTVASADFGAPGAGHRLPAAAEPHPGEGEHAQEGHVREAVPRRAAAGQRRRHERRRSVRRHAGDVHRRARRQAVQLLRRVGLAVPDDVVLVPEPVAAAPVRDAGLLADAVLLRLRSRRRSTAPSTGSSIATTRIATQTARGATAFGIYPINRYARFEMSAGFFNSTRNTTSRGCRRSPTSTSSTVRPHAVRRRQLHAARR